MTRRFATIVAIKFVVALTFWVCWVVAALEKGLWLTVVIAGVLLTTMAVIGISKLSERK